MWFHSQFVVVTLMGRQIKWGPQFRTDNETRWRDATRLHGLATLLAFGWVFGMYWLNPAVSVWLLPVGISLLLRSAVISLLQPSFRGAADAPLAALSDPGGNSFAAGFQISSDVI